MKLGVAVPAYGRAADATSVQQIVVELEQLGYDGAWFADHVAVPAYAREERALSPPFLEPLACCAWGLGATPRLRFGTDVLVAPYRHPLTVAAMAATVARLGGPPGRLVLGVGVGYLRGEFDALSAPPYAARGPVTDEWLAAVRQAWGGAGARAKVGEWFDFADVHVITPAPDTPVPLWVGGNGERAQRRAALLADGWHPLWPTPAAYAAARQRILAWREESGQPGPFTFSYSSPRTHLGQAEPAEDRAARAGVRAEYGYAPAAAAAPDGRARFTGSVEDLTEDLGLLVEAGVEHVTLRFFGRSTSEVIDQIRAFARDVAPRLPGWGDASSR